MKANKSKSNHVTFIVRPDNCPPVTLNNSQAQDNKIL